MQQCGEPDLVGDLYPVNCGPPARFADEISVASWCGTLTDVAEWPREASPNETMEAKYQRIDNVIAEIQLLVDLLFADQNLSVISPGDAA